MDGKTVCAGNDKLMEEIGVKWHPCHHVGTTVHVAVEGKYIGHIVISDEVKPDAKEAIAALKAQGVKKTVMLTGDAKAVGESVAKDLGMDEAYTQLLPGDKVDRVEALLSEKSPKGKLAFVGDGINDAPVLSRADIGIAMGAWAQTQPSSGGYRPDGRQALQNRQGHGDFPAHPAHCAAEHRLCPGGEAAGAGAHPVWHRNMWEAVFADVGVMVIAILNASRALQAGKKSFRIQGEPEWGKAAPVPGHSSRERRFRAPGPAERR